MKRFRKAITLLLLYSLVLTSVSGVLVYIGPIDRVAVNLEWTMLGLTKSHWDDVHTLFGFVLIIAGALHLLINGKVMFTYLRSHMHDSISRQFVVTLLVTILLFVATIYRWPPIDSILDFGEHQRRSWAREMMMQRLDELPPQMREMMLERMNQGGMGR